MAVRGLSLRVQQLRQAGGQGRQRQDVQTVVREDIGHEPAVAPPELPPHEIAPPLPAPPAVTTTTVVVQPAIQPAPPVERLVAPAPGPAPEPPTVHVTIGRIEVRAIPPTAPAAAQPRPGPPVMSLEEYLGRRLGGGDK